MSYTHIISISVERELYNRYMTSWDSKKERAEFVRGLLDKNLPQTCAKYEKIHNVYKYMFINSDTNEVLFSYKKSGGRHKMEQEVKLMLDKDKNLPMKIFAQIDGKITYIKETDQVILTDKKDIFLYPNIIFVRKINYKDNKKLITKIIKRSNKNG